MLVGEQPGDAEDLAGCPFVGPAGRVLDLALGAAGLARDQVYVTNAVKHFKWESRGKRRLHKRPGSGEIMACQFWLAREIAAYQPRVIVALGSVAVRSVLGQEMPLAAARGRIHDHSSGAKVVVTYHPAAILRARADAERLRAVLVGDLVKALNLSRRDAPKA
jgi:DNA polymerase